MGVQLKKIPKTLLVSFASAKFNYNCYGDSWAFQILTTAHIMSNKLSGVIHYLTAAFFLSLAISVIW